MFCFIVHTILSFFLRIRKINLKHLIARWVNVGAKPADTSSGHRLADSNRCQWTNQVSIVIDWSIDVSSIVHALTDLDGLVRRFIFVSAASLCLFLRLVPVSLTQLLKMTSAPVVETSVANNSSFQNFSSGRSHRTNY